MPSQPHPMLPQYIKRQWNNMTMDERREWAHWVHQELYKAEERRSHRLHEQPCPCNHCQAYRGRLRTKNVRDGKIKREPKPPRWRGDA